MKTGYTLAAIAVSLLLTACGSSDKEENVIHAPVADNAPSEEASDNSASDDSSEDEDSGDDSPPPTYSVGGKVIDGYVSGATVWIDFNNNGVKDEVEPSALSGDAGDYSLELSESERQCAQYSTWYVDVPVGAIDEDLGEVTEAYQMVRPPVLDAITDESLLHISPLTTALWQGIEEQLNGSTFSDCEALIADQEQREQVAKLVADTIYNTVNFYNISEDEIFEDFIAQSNDESKELAQEIVQGLQKSLTFSKTVQEQYPSADEIRVVHYFGAHPYYDDDNNDHWFRKVAVFEGDKFYSREDMMSESLEDVVRPIYYRDTISSEWGGGLYTLTDDVIYRGSEMGYECSYGENVSVVEADVTYELANLSFDANYVDSIEACAQPEFVNTIPERTFYISYDQDEKSYLADIRQLNGTITVLPDWVDLKDRSAEFDFSELVTELENSGYQFDRDISIPTNYWYKREYWFEDNVYIEIEYNHLNEWTKFTRFENGTHTDECSYDAGVTWTACEE